MATVPSKAGTKMENGKERGPADLGISQAEGYGHLQHGYICYRYRKNGQEQKKVATHY